MAARSDTVSTKTMAEQAEVEKEVSIIYARMRDSGLADGVYLLKQKHVQYLQRGIRQLSVSFESLDASRPWLCYWILHSLALLKSSIPDDVTKDVIDFLKRCQAPSGGFGGGPGQLPHAAPTYAAVLALCTLGTEEAFEAIDRPGLQRFLFDLRQPDGSFVMHRDGELDIRGAYCAIVSALLTNVAVPQLFEHTSEWIVSCQTYEGGFSAVPGTEAHGGYTFCGFAAAMLLRKQRFCNLQRLLKWTCNKQMQVEGGFQGRTNKLVDGCYSFWQGGLFPLVYTALDLEGDDALDPELWHFDQEALQEYILYCCQCTAGGLLDKPGKSRDFYHTCYCLSGLSISQHCYGNSTIIDIADCPEDILEPIHPAFNIVASKAEAALKHFSALPPPVLEQSSTAAPPNVDTTPIPHPPLP